MGILSQRQEGWKILSWGSKTVESLVSQYSLLTTSTGLLAYSSDWTDTSEPPLCAQNPANWPSGKTGSYPDPVVHLEIDDVRVVLRFLVADTADDEVAGTLWGRSVLDSAPMDLLVLNPITAGAAVCRTNPDTDRYAIPNLQHLTFSDGAVEVKVGDHVKGGTSEATATVTGVTVTSGAWADSDAAGFIYVKSVSGTFEVEDLTFVDADRRFYFNSGSTEISKGDTLIGATTHFEVKVDDISVTSGTWSSGNAAGWINYTPLLGSVAAENLNNGADSNVATLAAPSSRICAIATALTDFRYADTVTIGTNNCGCSSYGSSDGIREIRLDLRGVRDLFFDVDVDLPSGTNGTDVICLYRPY